MGAFSFWMVTAGIPVGQISFARIIRHRNQINQTATTDIFSILTYVDSIVMINPEPFQRYTNPSIPLENFNTMFAILAIVCCCSWVCCLLGLEKSLTDYERRKAMYPRQSLFFAWIFCAFFILINILLFTGSAPTWLTS